MSEKASVFCCFSICLIFVAFPAMDQCTFPIAITSRMISYEMMYDMRHDKRWCYWCHVVLVDQATSLDGTNYNHFGRFRILKCFVTSTICICIIYYIIRFYITFAEPLANGVSDPGHTCHLDLSFEFLRLVFVALVLGFGSWLFPSTVRARRARRRQGGLPDQTTRSFRGCTPVRHCLKIVLFSISFFCFLVDFGLQNRSQNDQKKL